MERHDDDPSWAARGSTVTRFGLELLGAAYTYYIVRNMTRVAAAFDWRQQRREMTVRGHALLKREPSNGNVDAERPLLASPDPIDELLFVSEHFCKMLGERSIPTHTEQRVLHGRPPSRSWPRVVDIAARLEALSVDDEAFRYIRQAVGILGAVGEDARKRAVAMLRGELARAAMDVHIPPLANVLLVMLEEEGCERKKLVEAAKAAKLLGDSKDPAKNLADRLRRTKKALRALPPLIEESARRAAGWRVLELEE